MLNLPAELHLRGIAASSGIAFGKAFLYTQLPLNLPCRTPLGAEAEFAQFKSARQQAEAEILTIRDQLATRTGKEELAAIFDAQVSMLFDPQLEDEVQARCKAGAPAEAAVLDACQGFAALLEGLEDELFAARAQDVRDIGERIARILVGAPERSLAHLGEPSIVIAADLKPSDTANLDPAFVRGFATEGGGLTSHTSILARTLGIPAVVGMGEGLLSTICDGNELLISGQEGLLIAHPSAVTTERYVQRQKLSQARFETLAALALQPARTAGGELVEVAANIGDSESAAEAVRLGAEGVGLLRTEFLYLNESTPPSEAAQVEVYRQIFDRLGDRPCIVRTLDIGGDKPPSYIHFEPELNPFLGWRGIRICLDDQPLFKTQLRAVLRAAQSRPVRLMFPMIASVEELRQAKAIVAQVCAELDAEGLPYNADVPVGIMVETPAAVAMVDDLARECDFFSIGTNDLTQYTLAVDRGNDRIAHLFQPLHPAVLRLIRQTITQAHARGRWVGMCGELAGMPKAIPILLGLGLDEFSMAPRAIPEAKWIIGQLTRSGAEQVAAEALQLPTSQEVEAYMAGVLARLQ